MKTKLKNAGENDNDRVRMVWHEYASGLKKGGKVAWRVLVGRPQTWVEPERAVVCEIADSRDRMGDWQWRVTGNARIEEDCLTACLFARRKSVRRHLYQNDSHRLVIVGKQILCEQQTRTAKDGTKIWHDEKNTNRRLHALRSAVHFFGVQG